MDKFLELLKGVKPEQLVAILAALAPLTPMTEDDFLLAVAPAIMKVIAAEDRSALSVHEIFTSAGVTLSEEKAMLIQDAAFEASERERLGPDEG